MSTGPLYANKNGYPLDPNKYSTGAFKMKIVFCEGISETSLENDYACFSLAEAMKAESKGDEETADQYFNSYFNAVLFRFNLLDSNPIYKILKEGDWISGIVELVHIDNIPVLSLNSDSVHLN